MDDLEFEERVVLINMIDKICITGTGVVTALGFDTNTCFQNLCCKMEAINELDDEYLIDFPKKRMINITTPLPNEDDKNNYGRACAMSMIAAQQALLEAQIDKKTNNVGVCIGTTSGNIGEFEKWYLDNHKHSLSNLEQKIQSNYPLCSITEAISDKYSLTGVRTTISGTCASGAVAIQTAFHWISSGFADIVLCGGVDVWRTLTQITLSKYRLITSNVMKSFDSNRDGMLIGEGAGFIILESEKSAKTRGVEIKAYLKGCGSSNDYKSLSENYSPAENTVLSMRKALLNAALEIDDIDCLFANGLATKISDSHEIIAINEVFQNRIKNEFYITTIKSGLGHILGASGAVNIAIAVETLCNQIVPPIKNLTNPDPSLVVGILPSAATPCTIKNIMCSCTSFSGYSIHMILGKE
ncbi:MAG: hypothetical protein HFH11_10240 [Dorea sp.]|nr:hypothetical protein [Clostridiales bacterium]MCI9271509.1 hypothetical protein [Dorea sp.]